MANAAYFADLNKSDYSLETKFAIVGKNSGNEAFISAISNLIELDRLPRSAIYRDAEELSGYDVLVTSDLIWLRQNLEAPDTIKQLLDLHPDKIIVPISIGLHTNRYISDFKISPSMLSALQRIAERATIAVRGNYTAEILLKNNIKNIEVIGCPSVYQYPLFHNSFKSLVEKHAVIRGTANFRTFYEVLKPEEILMLNYFADNCSGFVEQTELTFSEMKPFEDKNYKKIRDFIEINQAVHFSIDDWVEYCRGYNFSIGSRFHGNIVAMLAGVRSLIVVCDTRTRELSEFFSLPAIYGSEFNADTPLLEYYERADFTPFIADYHNKIARFNVFLNRNGLRFSSRFTDALEKFEISRIGRPWLCT